MSELKHEIIKFLIKKNPEIHFDEHGGYFFLYLFQIEDFCQLFKKENFDDGEFLNLKFRNDCIAVEMEEINEYLENNYDDTPITKEDLKP